MWRRWWIGAGAMLGLAAAAWARQGVVTTVSDQRYTGDIDTSQFNEVIVVAHGVQITIDTPDVTNIEYFDQVDQDFHDRLAKLPAADVHGRMDAAHWAMDLGRLDLAYTAASQAVALVPGDADAVELRTSIVQQLAAQNPTTRPQTVNLVPLPDSLPPMELTGNATTLPAPAANPNVRPILAADDIQEIRRNELKATDAAVHFRFDNDVRRRYAVAQRIDPGAFALASPLEQAIAIFSSGDAGLMNDVKVLTDPSAITAFRQRVQPILAVGCATSGCHGGTSGGDLFLWPAPDNEALTYTNFYSIVSYAHQVDTSGPFGAGPARRQMIDRTTPTQSLLLQYALPPALAQNPHPPLANYNGIVRDTLDPRYLAIESWITDALLPLDPKYDIPRPVIHRATTSPAGSITIEPIQFVPDLPSPLVPPVPMTPAGSATQPAFLPPAPAATRP